MIKHSNFRNIFPSNHLQFSISSYSYYLIACTALAHWKPGGYHCKDDKCINGNKGYNDFNTAWEECGKIRECGRIMWWTNEKFHLRRLDDEYDPNPRLHYVDYICRGKKAKSFTKSFFPLHIIILYNIFKRFC